MKKLVNLVGVLVIKDNKILLGLRNKHYEQRDEEVWALPGGKVRRGQTLEQFGILQVKIETNIDVEEIKVFSLQKSTNRFTDFVRIGMIAEKYSGEIKIMEPYKILRWEWFDINEIPENMFFPSKKILEKYKEGLFYKEV